MIEEIHNLLSDAGVQQDIKDKVESLMNRRCGNFSNIDENIRKLIVEAAKWGMSNGFRMGWRIRENRIKH